MLEYNELNVGIRDVQMIQLEILLEFDRICRKNNIKYQLFAGTLLGAVRHKGFIPWDDDIDVCLLRDDYEKFLDVCLRDLDPRFFLQTYETDEKCIIQFAKIRKNDTIFIEESTADCEIHQGIFIDVFPLDNIFPNTLRGVLHQKLLHIVGRINLCRIKRVCLEANKPAKRYLGLVCHYVLKVIPKAWTDRLQNKIIQAFSDYNAAYVSHLTIVASKDWIERHTVEKSGFYDCIECEFEGHKFPIPHNYDEILTRIYGNYMELPPYEERKPHHGIIEISLDTCSKR